MELKRYLEEKIFVAIAGTATVLTALLLILIIGKIALEALPALTPYFLTTAEINTPGFGQAIANAIVGTICLSLLSVAFAIPLSIGTAIYFKKYARENLLSKVVRFLIDVLSGMPSIVLGVFGMLFIVIYLKPLTGGFSLLSGALAMAILILPVIERSAEEAISVVPKDLEDGSTALGGTKWTTIRKITIPYALSGIMTGIVLGIGRSAEESAIVVLTAGYSQFYPAVEVLSNPKMPFGVQLGPFQEPIGVLSISVYHMFQFPNIVPKANGFAAALVLILLVMVINLSARVILWRWKIG
jgi:phosphate transport system permease protein